MSVADHNPVPTETLAFLRDCNGQSAWVHDIAHGLKSIAELCRFRRGSIQAQCHEARATYDCGQHSANDFGSERQHTGSVVAAGRVGQRGPRWRYARRAASAPPGGRAGKPRSHRWARVAGRDRDIASGFRARRQAAQRAPVTMIPERLEGIERTCMCTCTCTCT
jgi:hypothetical protein